MRPHLLARHLLGRLDLESERVAIEPQRRFEILHRDADVVENSLHITNESANYEPTSSHRGQTERQQLVRRRIRIDLARGDALHHRRRARRASASRAPGDP